MELGSLLELWKWFRWLPNVILKRVFSEERMSGLVLVDVRPRHRSVTANLDTKGSFEIWFRLINMSPFEVEIDRAEIVLQINGSRSKAQKIQKERFKAGQVAEFFIEGDINPADCDHIAKYAERDNSAIELHIDFNCKLHSFKNNNTRLEGVNVQYTNLEWRKSQLASEHNNQINQGQG
jgi:hypothetical protein